jgi:molybdopterin-guanine dinucleotide biosynthesis protein A
VVCEEPTGLQTVTIGVVLAGGEARRMGHDKRLLRLAGSTLLERNVSVLRAVFPRVVVSVRRDRPLPSTAPSGVEILFDELTGSPLAAIATALARYQAPLFVLAADMAFATPSAIEKVLSAYSDVDVALPIVGQHLEPLHAVYGPRCLGPSRGLLAEGRHSILDLLPLVRVARVPFVESAPFLNVNTPSDWRAVRRLAEEEQARSGEEQTGEPLRDR